MLMPAIGYIIIFNDDLREHLQLWRGVFGSGEVLATDAVPWRLLLIYFGLVALAVGSILYQIFCPVEVKRYASDMDFIADVEAYGSSGLKHRIAKNLARDKIVGSAFMTFERIRDDIEKHARALGIGQPESKADTDDLRNTLSLYFHTIDASARAARGAITILYSVGFVLAGIPSVSVFFYVLFYSIRAAIGAVRGAL
jgi:hypothetical protein